MYKTRTVVKIQTPRYSVFIKLHRGIKIKLTVKILSGELDQLLDAARDSLLLVERK